MKLVYDINAFSMIEEMCGNRSLINLISNPKSFSSVRILRIFIWAGLLHLDSKLTLKEAGNLLQSFLREGKTLVDAAEIISSAIKDSGLIEKAEGKSENPPAQ